MAQKAGKELRIVASKATPDKMTFMNSRLPKPTLVLANPKDSFRFEKLAVELHRFEKPAHRRSFGVQGRSDALDRRPVFLYQIGSLSGGLAD